MDLVGTLLAAAVGGLLAVAGAIAGAHWQAREARQARQEQFQREDRWRLFDQRRLAYARFMAQAWTCYEMVRIHKIRNIEEYAWDHPYRAQVNRLAERMEELRLIAPLS